ncbi:MAG: hypothetical protein R3F56_06225 [Planctomycetota bacterium]
MKHLQAKARELLERYLCGLRMSLIGNAGVDHREVERDIRAHIELELDGEREPVSRRALARVLHRLGHPSQWVDSARNDARAAPAADEREDWRLAYLSLALVVLALALPLFLWVGLFAAFLAARASLSAAADRHDRSRAQRWLVCPALLAIYLPLISALLLWPAVAVRLGADAVTNHAALAERLPVEVLAVAERIAALRLTSFDPATTVRAALRTGHFLIAPVGSWLLVLGVLARLWPGPLEAVFRPLVDDGARRLSRSLCLCGLVLCLCALVQGAVKTAQPGIS